MIRPAQAQSPLPRKSGSMIHSSPSRPVQSDAHRVRSAQRSSQDDLDSLAPPKPTGHQRKRSLGTSSEATAAQGATRRVPDETGHRLQGVLKKTLCTFHFGAAVNSKDARRSVTLQGGCTDSGAQEQQVNITPKYVNKAHKQLHGVILQGDAKRVRAFLQALASAGDDVVVELLNKPFPPVRACHQCNGHTRSHGALERTREWRRRLGKRVLWSAA